MYPYIIYLVNELSNECTKIVALYIINQEHPCSIIPNGTKEILTYSEQIHAFYFQIKNPEKRWVIVISFF